jgi:hypothetical protein
MSHSPEQPLVQAFLVCQKIYRDQHTGDFLLIAPSSGLSFGVFPGSRSLAVYAQFADLHGDHQFELQLHDPEGEIIWEWSAPDPVAHTDPLTPHRIAWYELVLPFPLPGRYALVLLANRAEVARHALQVNSA